ncbi:MAG: hypothetical protein AABW81_03900, partial [Nanoarchaeota archaeon]
MTILSKTIKKNSLSSKLTINQFEKVIKLFNIDINEVGLPHVGRKEIEGNKHYLDRWVENLRVKPYSSPVNEDLLIKITGDYYTQYKLENKDQLGIWRPSKPERTSFELKTHMKKLIKFIEKINELFMLGGIIYATIVPTAMLGNYCIRNIDTIGIARDYNPKIGYYNKKN